MNTTRTTGPHMSGLDPKRKRTRYAMVGFGGRTSMFLDPIVRDFREQAQLVACCDTSFTRINFQLNRVRTAYAAELEPKLFRADEFSRMLAECKPDAVIVCSPDYTHGAYIVEALAAGCDVISEKPMVTTAESCRQVLEAAAQARGRLRVSFNYRWATGASRVKEMLLDGVIGSVKQVSLDYFLDTMHGADYFRRWHSEKACSGGLIVHKSTHHFDLVNWWLDAIPEEVFGFGSLAFYGKENAVRRGDGKWTGYERYTGKAEKDDPFKMDLSQDDGMRGLYLDAEAETGYIRDRNVFRSGIDIEDTMSLLVRYRGGQQLNYSLVAYAPYEGYRVMFTGDRGRLEYEEIHGSHLITGQSDEELAAQQKAGGRNIVIRVTPHFGKQQIIRVNPVAGAHGGADPQLQSAIFNRQTNKDPLGRDAGPEQGAASILVGAAANVSFASNQPVRISALCPLRPDASRLGELT
ncbi:MAG: Gfo/Idh/MocA family oxidoreductase [Opitutaceae bacterium]